MTTLVNIGHAFIDLWTDAAFWLVLGLIIAGLLQSFINSKNIGKHLQGKGLWPAVKAAILGTPLPLCSCGVIPAAVGLRRAGASKSATTAFLISTPETGVDSIAISYALLGPFMAIIRPIAAVCSAIVAAALVLLNEDKKENKIQILKISKIESECSSRSCGCQNPTPIDNRQPFLSKLWQGQKYAFTELLEDLSGWLVIGLIISAIVVATVPYNALASISQGPAAMIIMALIGVPMYICASASTPLAAGLMLAGVSPGAILVFLLAGPATNIASLGIVKKELGWHTLVSYLTGVLVVAIGFGYFANFLIEIWDINISSEIASSNDIIPSAITWIASILLAVIVVKDLIVKISGYFSKKTSGGCNCHGGHCH
ncbi:SO_0444 family Cu/Zn efflux transporter [Vibrio salinus]|uniref:SO_0444 family Cu/Zn efflux transporter n=1 Tax=Vibrio salinus TaxID=2899784 RepID=UPI001E572EB5|nr:SO_0444 family Cu/Zn efflux transporter [Vibrio salinus]MCE0494842.1 SO_0444 family Cu/Zn efflux transporter [Vibrio salinus]